MSQIPEDGSPEEPSLNRSRRRGKNVCHKTIDHREKNINRRIRRPNSWVERQMLATHIFALVIFASCFSFSFLPLIFGLLGLTKCQDSEARIKALIVTIITVAVLVSGFIVSAKILEITGGHDPFMR